MKRGFLFIVVYVYIGTDISMSEQSFYLETIPYLPKTIGMIFPFQGLLACWSARAGVPVIKLYS